MDEKFFDELDSFDKDTKDEYSQDQKRLKYFREDINFEIVNKIIPREKWDEIVFSEKYKVDNDEEWITFVGLPFVEKDSFYKMIEILSCMNLKYTKNPTMNVIYPYVGFKFLSSKIRAGKIYYSPDTLYDVKLVPWHFGNAIKNVLTINYVPVPVLAEARF